MKQTVLIKVSMDGNSWLHCCMLDGHSWLRCCMLDGRKVRTKAMKIAVGVSGVESASLKGDDNDQIEVKGNIIDTVKLTTLLRKKVGPAHIISVEEVKKEEKKEEKKVECIAWPYGGGVPSYCSYPIYEVRDCHESSNPCSIM